MNKQQCAFMMMSVIEKLKWLKETLPSVENIYYPTYLSRSSIEDVELNIDKLLVFFNHFSINEIFIGDIEDLTEENKDQFVTLQLELEQLDRQSSVMNNTFMDIVVFWNAVEDNSQMKLEMSVLVALMAYIQ